MIKSKNYLYLIPVFMVLVSSFVLFGSIKKQATKKSEKEVLSIQSVSNSIKASINFGPKTVTTSIPYKEGISAYDALEIAAREKFLTLDTKKYDFGIFVNAIDGVTGNKENGWLFFVNGKSGDKSADLTTLRPGDSVEWRFTSFAGSM
jgi:hypothetical protein